VLSRPRVPPSGGPAARSSADPSPWVCIGKGRGLSEHGGAIRGGTRGRLSRRRSGIAALALLAGILCAVPAWAEKEPVSIKGDNVEYFDSIGKVVATGNVEAVYRDTKLTCDRATIYTQTKDAYLEGRVRIAQIEGLLKGEEIVYNFETRKGTVVEAEGEVGPWRTRGARAEKVSPDSFVHRGGYLTSCDFEDPHTRMKARQVRVYMDDKVVLKDVVMYIGHVPAFYLPSYVYPLDDKRPRVTITPGKSKEWGLFMLTSWRAYIHENLQGRIHVDFRERLDLAGGADLKYKLPVGGEGIFRTYYTHERELHREHFWSALLSSDRGSATTERERSRFQLRHVWTVDEFTRATVEYHRAQDPTVVRDFFEREFEQGGASPPTYFQVIHLAPWYGLTFLVNKRANRFETVTQKLPSISLDLRPIGLVGLPGLEGWINRLDRGRSAALRPAGLADWFYQSSFKYEHSNVADVRDGEQASLVMLDQTHEIYSPMRLLRRLNFRPFFKFRQSSFSRGLIETAPQFRQAAATGFDLSSKLFRVFNLDTDLWNLNIHRLRHVMTPNLRYEYQAKPTLSADRLLRSDGLAKSNVITPSLEHKLQTKRSSQPGGQTEDLARFNTSMPYNIEGSGGSGGEWQPVSMDLEMLPYSWIRVESDAQIDPHIGKFSTINADLVILPGISKGWSGRRIGEATNADTGEEQELPWAAGLGWRYQRNTSAQITLETEFNLGRKWRAGIYQAFDVKRFVTETSTTGDRTVKKIYDFPEVEYRLRRDLHEWTAELVYNVRRGQGQTLLLLFRLKAAPELPFEFERSYHRPKAGRNFRRPGEPIPSSAPVAPLQ